MLCTCKRTSPAFAYLNAGKFLKTLTTMTDDIAVDRLVYRASGGPMMLVLSIQEAKAGVGAVARCAWFDGFKLDGAEFEVSDLVLTPMP